MFWVEAEFLYRTTQISAFSRREIGLKPMQNSGFHIYKVTLPPEAQQRLIPWELACFIWGLY